MSLSPSLNTTEPSFFTVTVSWDAFGSGISCVSLSLRGTSRVSIFIMIGITTRKMMRRTRRTSIKGVTLMSLWTPPLLLPVDIPMALLLLRVLRDCEVDLLDLELLVQEHQDRVDVLVRDAFVGLDVDAPDAVGVLGGL